MLSKRGKRMHRFEALLGALPTDCVLDGEVAALDQNGRPVFTDLMFGRRPPIFLAFDVLVARGAAARTPQWPPEWTRRARSVDFTQFVRCRCYLLFGAD